MINRINPRKKLFKIKAEINKIIEKQSQKVTFWKY